MERLEKLQDQLTTGKRIAKASDDPISVARALTYRTSLAETGQYRRNIAAATAWLNATDSALGSAGQLLQRARELAIQGANSFLSAEDQQAIAQEVRQILEQMVQIGNSTYGSDHLFAGHRTATAPFVLSGGVVTYMGDNGSIMRETGVGAQLAVNIPGNNVFDAVFSALDSLADGLEQHDAAAVEASIPAIDMAMEGILSARSQVGAKVNRLEAADNRLSELEVNQSEILSKEEDLEMAEAIMAYSMAETVYRAALAAGARTIQPSLLDYLR